MINDKTNNWIKTILLLCIAMSVSTTAFISVPVGGYALSVFRFLMAVVMLLLIVRLFLPGTRDIIIPRKKKNRYSIIFFVAWFFYAVLSFFWAKDIGDWARAVFFIGTGTFMIIAISTFFTSKKDIENTLIALETMVIVHSLIGWYEVFTRDYNFVANQTKLTILTTWDMERYPPVSSLGENEFAGLMLFGLFIAMACFRIKKNPLLKSVSMLTVLSCFAFLATSSSRANQFGLILAILFLIVTSKPGKWAIPFGVCAAICAIPFVYDIVLDKLQVLLAADGHDSNSIRVNLIRNGFVFLRDTCGFGTGAGQIEYWMGSRAIYSTYQSSTFFSELYITNMHNWWMEILVAYGVIVFIGYVVFYVKLLVDLYRNYTKSKDFVALMLCCCMVGNVFGSMSSSTEIPCEWKWVFFALLIAYQGLQSRFDSENRFLRGMIND